MYPVIKNSLIKPVSVFTIYFFYLSILYIGFLQLHSIFVEAEALNLPYISKHHLQKVNHLNKNSKPITNSDNLSFYSVSKKPVFAVPVNTSWGKGVTVTQISSSEVEPAPVYNLIPNKESYLKIPSLNLDVKLTNSSVTNLADLEQKMLYNPILESELTSPICSKTGNSYIYGHSEPSNPSQANYPASNIFDKLHTLRPGDKIYANNNFGNECVYQVLGWDIITTQANNEVSYEDFLKAFYPDLGDGTLTIQTCQKGSSTVRLLLRARLIE